MIRRLVTALSLALTVAGLAALPGIAFAQQPLRIIFPFAVGSTGDLAARLLAERLRVTLDRTVVVENKTGASGRIGVQAAKLAAADGTTILLSPVAPMAIYPHVYGSLPYDPFNDFQAIAQVATFDFALAVGAGVPASSVDELVKWIKENPGQGNFGTPGAGTLPHFFGVLIARAAGIELVHVPYAGSAQALSDMLGGHLPVLLTTSSEVAAMHKAGRVRVLATSGTSRSSSLPEVPTFREQGFDIEGTGWYGVFAPAGVPADAVARLNKGIVAAIETPELKARLLELGLVPTGSSPETLRDIQRRDSELWAPAVKASGFRAEN